MLAERRSSDLERERDGDPPEPLRRRRRGRNGRSKFGSFRRGFFPVAGRPPSRARRSARAGVARDAGRAEATSRAERRPRDPYSATVPDSTRSGRRANPPTCVLCGYGTSPSARGSSTASARCGAPIRADHDRQPLRQVLPSRFDFEWDRSVTAAADVVVIGGGAMGGASTGHTSSEDIGHFQGRVSVHSRRGSDVQGGPRAPSAPLSAAGTGGGGGVGGKFSTPENLRCRREPCTRRLGSRTRRLRRRASDDARGRVPVSRLSGRWGLANLVAKTHAHPAGAEGAVVVLLTPDGRWHGEVPVGCRVHGICALGLPGPVRARAGSMAPRLAQGLAGDGPARSGSALVSVTEGRRPCALGRWSAWREVILADGSRPRVWDRRRMQRGPWACRSRRGG
jgi:hypothetical protein